MILKINIDGYEICVYQIKGSDEGDINNDILSCDAPMARALLGKKIGEKVKFNEMEIEILEVVKL